MSDRMTPADRQLHAEALRNNPLLASLLAAIREDCVNTWQTSSNAMQREDQWHRLMSVRELESRIDRAIDDGKMATAREGRARKAAL
jgi:hypothetical protein